MVQLVFSVLPIWDGPGQDPQTIRIELWCSSFVILSVAIVNFVIHCISKRRQNLQKHVILISSLTYGISLLAVVVFVLKWKATVNFTQSMSIYVSCFGITLTL